MNFGHELIEVHFQLEPGSQGIVRQIQEKRLSAAGAAPRVESLGLQFAQISVSHVPRRASFPRNAFSGFVVVLDFFSLVFFLQKKVFKIIFVYFVCRKPFRYHRQVLVGFCRRFLMNGFPKWLIILDCTLDDAQMFHEESLSGVEVDLVGLDHFVVNQRNVWLLRYFLRSVVFGAATGSTSCSLVFGTGVARFGNFSLG